jgi:hypothetical protein
MDFACIGDCGVSGGIVFINLRLPFKQKAAQIERLFYADSVIQPLNSVAISSLS